MELIPIWTEYDQIGLKWTELDQIGPTWTEFSTHFFIYYYYYYRKYVCAVYN